MLRPTIPTETKQRAIKIGGQQASRLGRGVRHRAGWRERIRSGVDVDLAEQGILVVATIGQQDQRSRSARPEQQSMPQDSGAAGE